MHLSCTYIQCKSNIIQWSPFSRDLCIKLESMYSTEHRDLKASHHLWSSNSRRSSSSHLRKISSSSSRRSPTTPTRSGTRPTTTSTRGRCSRRRTDRRRPRFESRRRRWRRPPGTRSTIRTDTGFRLSRKRPIMFGLSTEGRIGEVKTS